MNQDNFISLKNDYDKYILRKNENDYSEAGHYARLILENILDLRINSVKYSFPLPEGIDGNSDKINWLYQNSIIDNNSSHNLHTMRKMSNRSEHFNNSDPLTFQDIKELTTCIQHEILNTIYFLGLSKVKTNDVSQALQDEINSYSNINNMNDGVNNMNNGVNDYYYKAQYSDYAINKMITRLIGIVFSIIGGGGVLASIGFALLLLFITICEIIFGNILTFSILEAIFYLICSVLGACFFGIFLLTGIRFFRSAK